MKAKRESGIALIVALLVLFLVSAIVVGMSWMVMTDQRLGGNSNQRENAFYAAEAGMEKLTADMGSIFSQNGSITAANITSITATSSEPSLPGITYQNALGQSTYAITYPGQPSNPVATDAQILPPSPFAGLQALVTNFTLSVAAQSAMGSEVKLQRIVQTSQIPVFQFGIFSNMDLGFHAGDDFNFGGRVHSNGNLWLASGATLTLPAKVTTAKEVITNTIMNGVTTAGNWPGAVDVYNGSGTTNLDAQSPAQSVAGSTWNIQTLQAAESANTYTYNTGFSTVASSVYHSNIGVKETGITALNLGIVTQGLGGQSIDLIRLPVPGEDTSNPAKLDLRYYSQASIRILLSDYDSTGKCTNSDIMSLPEISAGTPVDLATLGWDTSATAGSGAPPYNTYPSFITASKVGVNVFPLPVSGAAGASYSATDGYWVKKYYPIITGCLKIDYQSSTSPGTFTDVTSTILNLGYTGPNIYGITSGTYPTSPTQPALPTSQVAPTTCTNPSPNAVIRLAYVRDNPSTGSKTVPCGYASTGHPSQHGTDYWPLALFDTRDGTLRDGSTPSSGTATLAGTMYYVELDVKNLASCLTSTTLCPFSSSVNNTTGYTVYFADRRGDRVDPNPPASVSSTAAKTGAFGYEEFVNESNATTGCPNNTLDQGEDVESDYNQNGNSENTGTTPRTYGGTPQFDNYAATSIVVAQGGVSATAPSAVLQSFSPCSSKGSTWPFATALDSQDLRENPALLFRRALKVDDGTTVSLGTCNSVPCGLTIAAENPVYVQGDYNNPGASTSFTGADVPASVASDAVTVLSDKWNDINSFASPYSITNRAASQTTYRMAVVTGKGIGFPNPSGTTTDTGSDGGAHNFLRYIEDWSSSNIYFMGSFVSFYYNHQLVGTFKCCSSMVYGIPANRSFVFDNNFTNPTLLPPRTPMLRNVNTIGFTQQLMPTQ